jgi:hypothetical protein
LGQHHLVTGNFSPVRSIPQGLTCPIHEYLM